MPNVTTRRVLFDEFVGRNGFDSPSKLLPGQCVEALNIDWYGSTFARKRGGASAQDTTGGTAFSTAICSLFRHVPTADDTAAEEWGIDTAGVVKRLAGGTAWANVTLDDAIGSRPQDINAATFNGKLFTCYGVTSATSTDTTTAATTGTNYVVAAGVTQLQVKAWGAGGGAATSGGKNGGGGGFAGATIPVTPGETLSKRVGGGGGGAAVGGGGGGYTGLFRGTTPLLIAPGGGGGSLDANGGAGGGTTGTDGAGTGTQGGHGGTQSAGGAAGGGAGSLSIDYLVVGGGGAGGNETAGGGGGGQALAASETIAAGSYAITVGAGGVNGGANGAASVFNAHSAAGGTNAANGPASNGGASGSGNGGGAGFDDDDPWAGGGGGGAGAGGGNAATDHSGRGGDGGIGVASSINGSSSYYGGGGGGGGGSSDGTVGLAGTGGAGGGGNGGEDQGNHNPQAGTANTGGGGGGGHHLNNGASGGSGIVIIRYLTSTAVATGGTITTSGSYTIHTFTANDTFLIGPVSATAGASLTGGTGGGWVSGGVAGGAGGTNGGGAAGAHGIAASQNVGGGGGAGYFGGGGGAGDTGGGNTGGGGGGSSFVSGTNTATQSGSGLNAGNNADADYGGNAGKGVINAAGNDGRLVIHATATVDRLHVYDPTLATPRIRRVGLAATVAPTVANTGAGAYPAVLRYYRQRTIQLDAATSTRVIRRSEPSPSVSFTPSGAGTAARVTRAAFPGEGETHWEIEASTDNITFYRLAQIVIGTTTYDDSAATTTYSSNAVSDLLGTYALPTAVKGIIATASRLLMAGAYVDGGKNNRIWWTPVLGSSDQGDDERIPTTLVSYTDLSENAGDTFVGFAGPIFDGTIYVFMQREIWRLTPTGDPTAPFLTRQISDSVGAIHQKSIFQGEDESGQPCVYFTSYLGHYRISRVGLQYIGRDNEDRWFGLYGQSAVNLTATNMVTHGVWHQAKHQAWFWQATGSNSDPDTKFCFDPKHGRTISMGEVRGGWSIHTGPSAQARCSVLFSNTLGAQMSRDLKPYIGLYSAPTILKTDTTDLTDNGTAFQAYLKSPPITPAALYTGRFGARDAQLQAMTQAGVTITLTLIANFGEYSNTSTVTLTADSQSGLETRVLKKFAKCAIANAENLQFQIGDGSAVASTWLLDSLMIPLDLHGVE